MSRSRISAYAEALEDSVILFNFLSEYSFEASISLASPEKLDLIKEIYERYLEGGEEAFSRDDAEMVLKYLRKELITGFMRDIAERGVRPDELEEVELLQKVADHTILLLCMEDCFEVGHKFLSKIREIPEIKLNPNIRDDLGCPALTLAYRNHQMGSTDSAMCKWLIIEGADPRLKDRNGNSAVFYIGDGDKDIENNIRMRGEQLDAEDSRRSEGKEDAGASGGEARGSFASRVRLPRGASLPDNGELRVPLLREGRGGSSPAL